MSYNTKNYTEQGGEKTVIGGVLEIKEEGCIKGLPHTPNIPSSSASTVNALKTDINNLLSELKEIGVVGKDSFTVTCGLVPNPAEENLVTNHTKVTSVVIDEGVITVTVPVEELISFPSSNPEQGTHKWVGLAVGTGEATLIGIKYGEYPFTEDDVTEATGVGCSAGEFVLYLKCDEAVNTPKVFSLSKKGYAAENITVKVVNPA